MKLFPRLIAGLAAGAAVGFLIMLNGGSMPIDLAFATPANTAFTVGSMAPAALIGVLVAYLTRPKAKRAE